MNYNLIKTVLIASVVAVAVLSGVVAGKIGVDLFTAACSVILTVVLFIGYVWLYFFLRSNDSDFAGPTLHAWPIVVAVIWACWWPVLDACAAKSTLSFASDASMLYLNEPTHTVRWYASAWFKGFVFVVPFGYYLRFI